MITDTLNHYRNMYQLSRKALGILNKTKAPSRAKGKTLRILHRQRMALQKEAKRVSWLVWPETGRPYMGHWEVVNQLNHKVSISGTLLSCIRFTERSKFGHFYRIRRCQ